MVAYGPSCVPNMIPHNLLFFFIVLKVNGSQSDKDERFKASQYLNTLKVSEKRYLDFLTVFFLMVFRKSPR